MNARLDALLVMLLTVLMGMATAFVVADVGEALGGEIFGSVSIQRLSKGAWITLGCLGRSPAGRLEGPGIGLQLGGSARSATNSTWKPRLSTLAQVGRTGRLIHRHINRPPGVYLVHVRGNRTVLGEGRFRYEGYYDWKWVEVKQNQPKVRVDLTIDPSNSGTVEVSLPSGSKQWIVIYMPLDSEGKLPLPDALLYSQLTSSVSVKGDKAVIKGLRPGKYRLAAASNASAYPSRNTNLTKITAKADVEVKRGSTTKVALTPSPATPSKRTPTTRRKERMKERGKEDPTGLPDLEVTKVYLNEAGFMRAQVKNRGTARATEHIVAFFIDGKRRANCRCMAIQPGAEFKASAMRLPVGTHVVKVVADADNKIPESDETNNSKQATLSSPR